MQIRNPLKNELGKLIELEDKIFRLPYNAGTSMGDEFPVLLGEGNLKNIYCAYDDGNNIISVVALLARDVLIEGIRYSVGSIGAVCTDERFRGQGIAGSILKRIHDELKDSVDFIIISGAGKLYTGFGARPIRNYYSYEITRAADDGRYSFAQLDHSNFSEAVRMQAQQANRFIRTPGEFKILLDAFSINYWPDKVEMQLVSRDGAVSGYILLSVFDREELYGVIKETAGLRDEEVIEAAAALNQKLSLKKIIYNTYSDIESTGISGKKLDNLPETFMIFDLQGVCEKLNAHVRQKSGLPNLFTLEKLNSSIIVNCRNDKAVLSPVELLSLVFDIDSGIYGRFGEDAQGLLKKVFPLRFPQIGVNYQ